MGLLNVDRLTDCNVYYKVTVNNRCNGGSLLRYHGNHKAKLVDTSWLPTIFKKSDKLIY